MRGKGLGGSSIFVKIMEYVHRDARSDVEEGGRNGSGRLLDICQNCGIVMQDRMLKRVGGIGLGGSSIFVKIVES